MNNENEECAHIKILEFLDGKLNIKLEWPIFGLWPGQSCPQQHTLNDMTVMAIDQLNSRNQCLRKYRKVGGSEPWGFHILLE